MYIQYLAQFSTKHRAPLIDKQIEDKLYAYLGGICKGLECNPIQVGGYRNHVHILCLLSKKIAQMKLLEEVKKQSSKWMKTNGPDYANFYWQDGYAIFSVNPAEVDVLLTILKIRKNIIRREYFKMRSELL